MAFKNCPVSPRHLPILGANAPLELKPPFKAPSRQQKRGFLQPRQYEPSPSKMWQESCSTTQSQNTYCLVPPQKNRLHLFLKMYSICPPFGTVKLPKAVQETARTCKTLKKLITANRTVKNCPCDFLQLLAFAPLKLLQKVVNWDIN